MTTLINGRYCNNEYDNKNNDINTQTNSGHDDNNNDYIIDDEYNDCGNWKWPQLWLCNAYIHENNITTHFDGLMFAI